MPKLDHNIAEAIRNGTSKTDRAQVASKYGLKDYTLKSIVYCESAMQDEYRAAVRELARRAIESANERYSEKHLLTKTFFHDEETD